jgi:hypothetical protein
MKPTTNQETLLSNQSRVQRAFNTAAFFWLDRTEFPLSDFLMACTTNFLLRPDFTNDDAAFILKWIEKQKRDPKSTLNKTLKQQVKIGIVSKDLQVVRDSLKAFMKKPKIQLKTTKPQAASKNNKPAQKTKKVIKPKLAEKKSIIKKTLNKKISRPKKAKVKTSLLKKVKSSVKNALLHSLKHKNKKRRAA